MARTLEPEDGRGREERMDEAKRPRIGRRVVYAAGELPDDLVAALRAAEPPAETAQYDWELTADDGAGT